MYKRELTNATILMFFIFICLFGYFVYFCGNKTQSMENVLLSIPEQVTKALDGRTQRWLSFEVRIAEQELSKKMNDVLPFTQKDIDAINERLNSTIILPTVDQ